MLCSFVFLALAAAAPDPGPLPSLAVFSLQAREGVAPSAAALLTDALVASVRRHARVARVMSPEDVTFTMGPSAQAVVASCASDSCAMVDEELAGALGVTHILVGNAGALGESYLLNLRILELRTGQARAVITRRLRGRTAEVLLDAMNDAAIELLVEAKLAVPVESGTGAGRIPFIAGAAGGGVVAIGGATLAVLGAAAGLGWIAGAQVQPELKNLVPYTGPGAWFPRAFGPALGGGILGALGAMGALAGIALAVGLLVAMGIAG